MESQSNFVVAFAQEGPMVRIAELSEDVQAVQFAINLHRSSNLKHSVFVFENDNVEPLVVFTLK